MNTHERTNWQERVSKIALGVVILGIAGVATETPVYQLFPWLLVGMGGAGTLTVATSGDTTIATLVMYTYGFVGPAFSVVPYGHDGILVAVLAVLSVVGFGLLTLTVDRFGGVVAGMVGGLLGVGLSTIVLHAL